MFGTPLSLQKQIIACVQRLVGFFTLDHSYIECYSFLADPPRLPRGIIFTDVMTEWCHCAAVLAPVVISFCTLCFC